MNWRRQISRSSRPKVFCKKDVLRNFAKFTGNHLCQNLFFKKFAGLWPATSLKKRLWHRCFPVSFRKVLRTTSFIEHLRWLLLMVRSLAKLKNTWLKELSEAVSKLTKNVKINSFAVFLGFFCFFTSKSSCRFFRFSFSIAFLSTKVTASEI